MKKFVVALVLGSCLLLTGSSAASADVLCTDDIIVGLPVEVCVNVPGADPSPVPVPPEVPSTPVQPAPQPPEVPVTPHTEPEPQVPDAPVTEPTPTPTPSEEPTVRPAPEDEAQSHLEEQLFPFLVGGVLLLIIFFVSKLIEDFRASRAKTLDKDDNGV